MKLLTREEVKSLTRKVSGNGHHCRQKLAVAAGEELVSRWKEDKSHSFCDRCLQDVEQCTCTFKQGE